MRAVGPDVVCGHGRHGRVFSHPLPLMRNARTNPFMRPPCDRDLRGELAVRPARVEQVRGRGRAGGRCRAAGSGTQTLGAAVLVHRDAVGARERAEVVIERAVLLHDEHQVVDVHDARRRVERTERVGHRLQPAELAVGGCRPRSARARARSGSGRARGTASGLARRLDQPARSRSATGRRGVGWPAVASRTRRRRATATAASRQREGADSSGHRAIVACRGAGRIRRSTRRPQPRNGQGSSTSGGIGSCVKSKSSGEVAEQLDLLAHRRPRVGPPVGLGVEALRRRGSGPRSASGTHRSSASGESMKPRLRPRADHHRRARGARSRSRRRPAARRGRRSRPSRPT